jgi:aminoglycoside phosphotransferase (APT) family kinase protein
MLLTETNIVHYLLDRGLFDKPSFENGHFSCDTGNSRHKNYIVNKEFESHCYFIKQALGSTAEKIHSLEREGLFYELAAVNENFAPLQNYMLTSRNYDQRNAILVLDYLSHHSSIYDKMLHQQNFNTAGVATELADALFQLHSIPDEAIEKLSSNGLISVSKPWILTLPSLQSPAANAARSESEAAGLQLIYQMPGFMNLVEKAATLWEPTCLVHGDSKLNNFLIKEADPEAGDPLLKLIDWELFNLGDPLWDLATVFQSALTVWVIHEDPVYKTNTGLKPFDLGNIKRFISACFTHYAAAHTWSEVEYPIKLEKCTAFCGLRLLHNCFETTPHAKSLRPYSARLLQLTYNILSNPAEAAKQVLGINL